MKIPWKFKSFLFAIIDRFGLHTLLYGMQKHITRSTRISSNFTKSKAWGFHASSIAFLESEHNIKEIRLIEFGAGKSLIQNLYQTVIDLNEMIDVDLVDNARKWLYQHGHKKFDIKIKSLEDIGDYNIKYVAPEDMRSYKEDKPFNICISTNTLEHIPKSDIEKILSNTYKILDDGGLLSAKIDYSDHYSHTDPSISPLNYLQYSASQWDRYNHSSHFQNRMRHSDYIKLIQEAGFEIISQDCDHYNAKVPDKVLCRQEYSDDDITALHGYILARKRADK